MSLLTISFSVFFSNYLLSQPAPPQAPLVINPPSSSSSSNTSISAPEIEWQKTYSGTARSCNLVQTSDGGYIFVDKGGHYAQGPFLPSTVYKVDALGSLQWNKTVNLLGGSTIIQTKDEGYEIAGQWRWITPTLIKMDSQGDIQWVANYTDYSSEPDLGIASTSIQTSDGGFVYWNWDAPSQGITKTDSNNNTQWVKTLYYKGSDGTAPLQLSSVIETSDGALAALGVGYDRFDNAHTGKKYLIKTETFLPLPSQTPLPTPIPTPTPTPLPASTVEAAIAVSPIIAVLFGAGLLFYLKKRHANSGDKT